MHDKVDKIKARISYDESMDRRSCCYVKRQFGLLLIINTLACSKAVK